VNFSEVPIGAAFNVFNGATPASGAPAYWDGDIPWVGPADLGKLKSRFIEYGGRSITPDGYASCGTQMVPEGTIILSIRAPIGHMAIASQPMCFNQGCRGLVPRPMVRTDFAYWSLLAHRPQLEAAGQGTTFIELGRNKLRAERIPLPDLDTQKAIADFLDRETARIDQLIEKRSQFAELVHERRLAMVSAAIVGATTDAAPWLGKLPDGWKAERAKVHFRESQQRSETREEELLTVSHITGVTKRSEKDVNMFLAESNEGYKLVEPDDLVINTMWAWMGAMGVSSNRGLISPSYGIYRPVSEALRPNFVDLMVRSKPFIAEATRRSKGIHSSRLRLYPDAFLDMLLPIPPIEKQDELLSDLGRRFEKEDQLLLKNRRADELLREFRAALITAAVTGQIDVTTWAKQGQTDRRLGQIEEDMSVREARA
jgi:type I restriction enzyme S subunit